jgi:hypothetical protein
MSKLKILRSNLSGYGLIFYFRQSKACSNHFAQTIKVDIKITLLELHFLHEAQQFHDVCYLHVELVKF